MTEAAEVTTGAALAGLVILGAYVMSFVLWAQAFSHYGRDALNRLVPLRSREQPFWSPVHFLLTFGFFIVSVSLMLGLTFGRPEMQTLVTQLTLNTLGGIAAVVGAILIFSIKVPDAVARLGLVLTAKDVQLGLVASLMILPPVMIISGLVSNLVEYHHPVLDSLKAEPGLRLFIVMVIGTAVITPFVEEFLFRVLLQGGLQGIADHVSRNRVAESAVLPIQTTGVASPEPQPINDIGLNPYAVGTLVSDVPSDDMGQSLQQFQSPNAFQPRAWWPIIIASILFAGMHLGQGAAPIPLFFLSVGLGFLYRQTGTITAPLVVHAVLNFITLAVNFAELTS